MSPIVTLLCALSLIVVAPFSQALTPPHPTHVLLDLQVLSNGDALLHHSHGVFRRSPTETAWKHVLESKEIRKILARQNEVYAVASDSLYLSRDYGATWTKAPAHEISAIGNDGTLYGCGDQGEDASKDQGRTWQLLNPGRAAAHDGPPVCSNTRRYARRKGTEYTVEDDNHLYYRGGPGERWIRRPLEHQFTSNDLFTGLHADRNGILYMNVATIDRSNAYASSPQTVYLSRDGGERWEAISWDHSRVRPLNPQVWGIWNSTLLLTCEVPGHSELHLCESSDDDPNSVVFRPKISPHPHIIAPDGAIYTVDLYDIKRLGRGEETWQNVTLDGVPDDFGRPRVIPPR